MGRIDYNKLAVFFIMVICFILALLFSFNKFTGYATSEGYLYNLNMIGVVFFLSGIFAAFYLLRINKKLNP